eukprot:SAG22_NODE_3019_length_2021_cov_1.065557_3_plen_122_part_00
MQSAGGGPPAAAAAAASLFTGEDEEFAFKRAVSRLAEMQSGRYVVTAALRVRSSAAVSAAGGGRSAVPSAGAAGQQQQQQQQPGGGAPKAPLGQAVDDRQEIRREGDRAWYVQKSAAVAPS